MDSVAARRTSDLPQVVRNGFAHIRGPKFVCVDLNTELADISSLQSWILDGGIVDLGSHADAYGSEPNAPTCFAAGSTSGTIRDYISATPDLLPVIRSFQVIRDPQVPTHAILQLQLQVQDDATRRSLPPTKAIYDSIRRAIRL